MGFDIFRIAVAVQFDRMQAHPMFRVDCAGDAVWQSYLAAFPEGANPLFRQRTLHDCACCRGFIRTVGNCVAVIDGEIESIWDISIPDETVYQEVADTLAAQIKARPISDVFLHFQQSAGIERTFEQVVQEIKEWTHFHVRIKKSLVKSIDAIPTALAAPRTRQAVLRRSLDEITLDALDTVLDLIAQKSLYRGEEHEFVVTEFRRLKRNYEKLTPEARAIFGWTGGQAIPESITNIRNHAIGTLLLDLSGDRDLESAVNAFDRVMAPSNYKRSTALVTPAMILNAKAKLLELGLDAAALERRYATLQDVKVTDLLFANRSNSRTVGGDIFDELAASTPARVKTLNKVEEVPIERFVADILPRVQSIEVLFENRHAGNLVSLVAPRNPASGNLLQWDNNISWSYNGGTDAIREKVKKAGGNVTGDLCCRLAWHNYDDLDLHMLEPGRYEIYYATKHRLSPSGGHLDVDMNATGSNTREPVENIYYLDRGTMREGVYTLFVQQFRRRETTNVGFEVEIDFMGDVKRFAYDKALRNHQEVTVAQFSYSKLHGIEYQRTLPSTEVSRTLWGLPTQTFHNVNVMMLSPNHWGERGSGHKHYFFMLEGCLNEADDVRGFFNEFLHNDFRPHRKAFELLSAKLTLPASNQQLSGLGFSSTQRNSVVCRVKGSFTRTIKVTF